MAEHLKGKTFGHLKVIEYDREHQKWKCLCECGSVTYVATRNLKTGNTKSCGCMRFAAGQKRPRKGTFEKLLYKDVGQLRVVSIDKENEVGVCLCLECNKNTVRIPLNKLEEMYNTRKKCYTCEIDGCVHTRRRHSKRTSNSINEGEKFGDLIVLKRLKNKVIKTKKSFSSIPMFLCKCTCGEQIEVEGRYLINEKVTDCGCKKGNKIRKRVNYSDILSTENGKTLYTIYKRWVQKFRNPSNAFKKNIIDCNIKFFPELDKEDRPFEIFYRWAILSGFSKEKCYLDRISYLEDFSKRNCYWTNKKSRGY